MADAVLKDIQAHDKKAMKNVDTQEKVVLPDKEAIAQEKSEVELRTAIEKGRELNHVETAEKNTLPTKEVIEEEKRLSKS